MKKKFLVGMVLFTSWIRATSIAYADVAAPPREEFIHPNPVPPVPTPIPTPNTVPVLPLFSFGIVVLVIVAISVFMLVKIVKKSREKN